MKLIYLLPVVFCCNVVSLVAQNSLDFFVKGEELKVVYRYQDDKQTNKKATWSPSSKALESGYKFNTANDYLSIEIPARTTTSIFKSELYNQRSDLGASNDIGLKISYNATKEVTLKFNIFYFAEKGDEKNTVVSEKITLPATAGDKYLLFDLSPKFTGNYKKISYFYVEVPTPLQEDAILNIKRIHIGEK